MGPTKKAFFGFVYTKKVWDNHNSLMEKVPFSNSLHFAAAQHPEQVFFSYHINTFDWPIPHSHLDYWEFTILTEGEIENHIDGKLQLWHQGNVTVMTPNNSHYLRKSGNEDIRYINIMVREDHVKLLLDAVSTDLFPTLSKGAITFSVSEGMIAQIEDLLHKANFYVLNRPSDFNKCVGSAAMLLLQSLIANTMNQGAPANDFQSRLFALSLKPEFLLYTIDDLCRDLHYSRVQLYRLFKTNYNITPHEYLLSHKLSYANSLLFSTDLSTMDIASKVGFSNLSQFNVDFKKEFGLTPGQCRKKSVR
jgi:AraC-like DNA-binding protein/mannose-6-phosphate isomerase-like protein (cupin superfamily)